MSRNQPLRVLHIASGDLWAGAEVQLYTLLSCLRKHGDTFLHVALMNEGELANRLRERGIAVTVFDETRLNALQILAGLRRLMIALKPDIVHTHRSKENILGSLANLLATRAASVRTVHGAPEHTARGLRKLPKRLLQELDRWIGANLQQRIIAVSHDLAQKLQRMFPPSKIIVIENGVDIADVHARIKPVDFRVRDSDAIHVGIVGRLVPVKRVDLFLEASAHLHAKHPSKKWCFHVFGDGPLREQFIRKASDLDIAAVTIFHGHRDDIAASIAGLDVLVMCSDHEGLPMTILEAMVIGARIAAHAVGGIPTALQNYPQAELIQRHDSEGYANAIDALLNRPPLSIPSDVLEHISAERNARQMLCCYLQHAGKTSSDS